MIEIKVAEILLFNFLNRKMLTTKKSSNAIPRLKGVFILAKKLKTLEYGYSFIFHSTKKPPSWRFLYQFNSSA